LTGEEKECNSKTRASGVHGRFTSKLKKAHSLAIIENIEKRNHVTGKRCDKTVTLWSNALSGQIVVEE
jgi:hypothetical protein